MITAQEQYRLCRHLGRILAEEEPGEGWSQFQDKLLASPELRQIYYRLMALHVELHWRQSKGRSLDFLLNSLEDRSAVAATPVKPRGYTLPAKLMALAASLALVAYFAGLFGLVGFARWNQVEHAGNRSTAEPPFVGFAEIAASDDAVISSDETTKTPGDQIASESLQIPRGIVELTFASGVKVAVEGPADFTPTGTNSGKLTRGRLVAQVPEAAEGFTIETPHAKFIDLGTEFGIEVDAAGEANLAVITGKVEVQRAGSFSSQAKPEAVSAGSALRASATHFHAVAFNSTPFETLRQRLGSAVAATERRETPALREIDLVADKNWEWHWNTAEVWEDGQVPSPLGHYHVGRDTGKRVRTPGGHHSDPFLGGILSIHPGGDLALKHTGKAILRELRLEGGDVFVWDQLRRDSRLALDCRLQVLAESRVVLNGCRLLVVAAMGGEDDLALVGPGAVELQTDSRDFAGDWQVQNAALIAKTLGCLGQGSVYLVGESRLILGYEWNNPQAEVSLDEASRFEFSRNVTLKSITLAGQPMPPGSYTHEQLQQKFPGRFAGDKGTLTVISSGSTSLSTE